MFQEIRAFLDSHAAKLKKCCMELVPQCSSMDCYRASQLLVLVLLLGHLRCHSRTPKDALLDENRSWAAVDDVDIAQQAWKGAMCLALACAPRAHGQDPELMQGHFVMASAGLKMFWLRLPMGAKLR